MTSAEYAVQEVRRFAAQAEHLEAFKCQSLSENVVCISRMTKRPTI